PRYETVEEQLTMTLSQAWGKGVLTNPADGVSDIRNLARLMAGYDRFFPAIQNVEGRSLAQQVDDPATTLDDEFGHLTAPVIYFGATNMGADSLLNGIYSATASGSEDVTINVLENHGHVDVLVGETVRDQVFAVIERWIRRVL
ncbi:MAG: hypothetical protein KDI36_15080, partial [Pseudomonadales bacterium]|nr:hypothetical protein [Pseudomonadales bacterium]